MLTREITTKRRIEKDQAFYSMTAYMWTDVVYYRYNLPKSEVVC